MKNLIYTTPNRKILLPEKLLSVIFCLIFLLAGRDPSSAQPIGPITGPVTVSGTEIWYDDFAISGSGVITVTGNLTISGAGITLRNLTSVSDNSYDDAVFRIRNGGSLTFADNTNFSLDGFSDYGRRYIIQASGSSSFTMDNSVFGNTAGVKADGFIHLAQSDMHMRNGAAINGIRSTGGSAIIIRLENSRLTMENSTLSNNEENAFYSQDLDINIPIGIISATGSESEITITSSNVSNNRSVYGTTIGIREIKSLTIGNSTFSQNKQTKNSVHFGAGVITAINTKVIINDSNNFSGNSAQSDSDCFFASSSEVTIGDHNLFKGESTESYHKDCISLYKSKLKVGNWNTFEDLSEGVFSINNTEASIGSNNRFQNNSTTHIGSVINCRDSVITIEESNTFSGNYSPSLGGVIYTERSTISIAHGNNFSENTAVDRGGAIYSYDSDLTIARSTFTKNAARNYGGAICHNAATLTLNGTMFEGNSVGQKGGALFVGNQYLAPEDSQRDMTIVNIDDHVGILRNSATDVESKGGAIYIAYDAHVHIGALTISSNRPLVNGGAFFADLTSETYLYNRFGPIIAGNRIQDKTDSFDVAFTDMKKTVFFTNTFTHFGKELTWFTNSDGYNCYPEDNVVSEQYSLFRLNSAAYGAAIYSQGILEIGEPDITMNIQKVWLDDSDVHGDRPNLKDFMTEYMTFRAEDGSYDHGAFKVEQVIQENEREILYRMETEKDPQIKAYAQQNLEPEDQPYNIHIYGLPQTIDGAPISIRPDERKIHNYIAETHQTSQENNVRNYDMTNTWKEDPTPPPTATPIPTETPEPTQTPTAIPEPTEIPTDVPDRTWFRLMEQLEVLPGTGL